MGEDIDLLSQSKKQGNSVYLLFPLVVYQYIENYCLRNGIGRGELVFPLITRAIQEQLDIVCDHLDYDGISTHSFKKLYETIIYRDNGYDLVLVQLLLQYSSGSITQRYIGIELQRIGRTREGHAELI